MNNKYKEALHKVIKLKIVLNEIQKYNYYIENCDVKALQELVDRATPKKPLEIIFNNFGMGERIGRCPNCKILVNQFQTHCKCDQKLDWDGL